MSAARRATPARVALLSLFALVAGAGACRSATVVAADDAVQAYATADSLRVANVSDRPVFTFVIGAESAPLALWGTCVDGPGCPPPIPPGGTRTVARPAYDGRQEREAIVYWWRRTTDPPTGAARADSVRALRVRFP